MLVYKILWFEDDDDAFTPKKRLVEEYVKSLAFTPNVTRYETDCKASEYNNYDLVLMDLNLQDQITGRDIITHIRDMSVYTTVILYSSDIGARLDEALQEGVYYSTRDNLVEKAKTLIRLSVKRLMSPRVLRGIVLEAVSSLESMVSRIVGFYYSSYNEDAVEKLRKSLIKEIVKDEKSLLTCEHSKSCTHKWETLSVNQILEDRRFDAYKRARVLKRILAEERENLPNSYSWDNFLPSYLSVVQFRNRLAHVPDCELNINRGSSEEEINPYESIFQQIRGCNEMLLALALHFKIPNGNSMVQS